VRLLLDTSVAIALRDLDPEISGRIEGLDTDPLLSIISVVELEGGVARAMQGRAHRRRLLDEMLDALEILPFGLREAEIYGAIVASLGFARSKVIDRMIAAQAIAVGATLATLNPKDFGAIPRLMFEDWTRPAA
jgi:tRNA(fMet)-specific endonuclease VapC